MKKVVIAIKDTAAEVFSQPLALPNLTVFKRELTDAFRSKNINENWLNWPEQYQVWTVGIFDDETGVISETVPQYCFNMSEVITQPE